MKELILNRQERVAYLQKNNAQQVGNPSSVQHEGREFTLYTYTRDTSFFERVIKCIKALVITIFTAFTALISRHVRAQWSESFSCKESIFIRTLKNPIDEQTKRTFDAYKTMAPEEIYTEASKNPFKYDLSSSDPNAKPSQREHLVTLLEELPEQSSSAFLSGLLSNVANRTPIDYCIRIIHENFIEGERLSSRGKNLYYAIIHKFIHRNCLKVFWEYVSKNKDTLDPALRSALSSFCQASILFAIESKNQDILGTLITEGKVFTSEILPTKAQPNERFNHLSQSDKDTLIQSAKAADKEAYKNVVL